MNTQQLARRGTIRIAEVLAASMLQFVILATPASAQHDHSQHHPSYQNWVNQNDKGCCNNQDCGTLNGDDERTTAAGVEVKIEGEWCAVQPWHYLKRGNAPDWSTSHVCVLKQYADTTPASVCARLLCYQPKPGT